MTIDDRSPVIAKAEALLKDITPGEWQVAPCSDNDEVRDIVEGYSENVEDGRRIRQAHWIAELDAALDFDSDREQELATLSANAEFIAAAPQLVRDLLAQCARDQQEKADLKKALVEAGK